ncbi:uncharacterized protein B4U79_16087, partial [Dinothrombium tinctorium]
METVWEDIQLQESNGNEINVRSVSPNKIEENCFPKNSFSNCDSNLIDLSENDEESDHYSTPPDSPLISTCSVNFDHTFKNGNSVSSETECEGIQFKVCRRQSLIDELLNEIYLTLRKKADRCLSNSSDTSSLSALDLVNNQRKPLRKTKLKAKAIDELNQLVHQLQTDILRMNTILLQCLQRRDKLITRRNQGFDIITAYLQAISPKR